jgi:hypothetical protein
VPSPAASTASPSDHLDNRAERNELTTATKRRTKPDVLAGLKTRNQDWAEAKQAERVAAHEHGGKLARAKALTDERRQLAFREPGLVDHRGQPNPEVEDIRIVAIDRELAELGDLEDLAAKAAHARALEQRAKQSWVDFVCSHYWEIIEASQPEAEAVAEQANEAARAFGSALQTYLEFHGRMVGFTTTMPGLDVRVVPGLDAAAELRRIVEKVDLAPPIPEIPHD